MPIKISSLLKSGLKPDPTDERDFSFSTYAPPEEVAIKIATALPSFVDYTAEMSPVKYQSSMGSCVSFAVAALKEWQERKEDIEEVKEGKDYKRKTDFYNFSEQWIYWNCKKIDSWPGQEGSDLRSAMKVLNKIGVPTEEAWPYIPSLTNIGEPKKWANLIARWSVIGSYWRLNNLDEVKRALVESPIVIAIPLFEDFYRMPNKTGILPMPKKNAPVLGWHAVTLVGFADDIQCVKLRNSWSIYWSNRGYCNVPYDYINEYMGDAWTAKDIKVTRDMLKGTRSLIE